MSDDGRKRHLCPVCLEDKTHIVRHLYSCGLERAEPRRPKIECEEMRAEENERVSQLALKYAEVSDLKSKYGENWGLVAHELVSVGVPVKIRAYYAIYSTEDLHEYFRSKGLKLSSTNPLKVLSEATGNPPSVSPTHPASKSKRHSQLHFRSATVATLPPDASDSAAEENASSTSLSVSSVLESAGPDPVILASTAVTGDLVSTPVTSPKTDASGLSTEVSATDTYVSLPSIDKSAGPDSVALASTVVTGDSVFTTVTSPKTRASGFSTEVNAMDTSMSFPSVEESAGPDPALIASTAVTGDPVSSTVTPHKTDASGSSTEVNATDTYVAIPTVDESAGHDPAAPASTVVTGDPVSITVTSPRNDASGSSTKVNAMETSVAITSVDELSFEIPEHEDDFLEKLGAVIDKLDWLEIERRSQKYYDEFGTAALCRETSVFRTHEAFLQKVKQYDLIGRLHNTPGMPRSEDSDMATIQQWVAVSVISEHFRHILEESTSVLQPSTPKAVFDMSPAAELPCSDVIDDVTTSPASSPLRTQTLRQRNKRKYVIDSDDETELTGPQKRKRINTISDSDESDTSPIKLTTPRENRRKTFKNLQENNFHLSLSEGKRFKEENKYMLDINAASKALKLKSTLDKFTGNVSRIMKFFAPDNNPDLFKPEHLTSRSKLHEFVNFLNDNKTKGQTKSKYFQHLKQFAEMLAKSDDIRKSKSDLKAELEIIAEEAHQHSTRACIEISKERNVRRAAIAHEKDTSVEDYAAFRETVSQMDKKVRPLIAECIENKQKAAEHLKVINNFFLALFVQLGARPCVFTNMPYSAYKLAKAAMPFNNPDVGPTRTLVSPEHKTGPNDLANVILTQDQFDLITTYVKHIRPNPAPEHSNLLFVNSVGHPVRNSLEYVCKKFKLDYVPATTVRHYLETMSSQNLEGRTRELVSKFLCHSKETGDRHYVDKSMESSQQAYSAILRLTLPGQSSCSSIANKEESKQSGLTESAIVRSASPALSEASSGSSGSSSGERGRRNRSKIIRELLAKCFKPITVDSDLPTRAEFTETLSKHAKLFPGLEDDYKTWKSFDGICREAQNQLRAENILAELGSKRLSCPEEILSKRLKERGWYTEHGLLKAKNLYSKRVFEGKVRVPSLAQAPTEPSPTIAKRKKSEPTIDSTIKNGITTQRWPLLIISETENKEKGTGIFARKSIDKGTIVCDYHGRLLSYAEGHKKYLSNETENNRYMFYFEHKGNRHYIDAVDPHCPCHPSVKLKGRLINHSKKAFNLEPRAAEFEGKSVILFIAVRDIKPFEELLFYYGCDNDSLSTKETWMKS